MGGCSSSAEVFPPFPSVLCFMPASLTVNVEVFIWRNIAVNSRSRRLIFSQHNQCLSLRGYIERVQNWYSTFLSMGRRIIAEHGGYANSRCSFNLKIMFLSEDDDTISNNNKGSVSQKPSFTCCKYHESTPNSERLSLLPTFFKFLLLPLVSMYHLSAILVVSGCIKYLSYRII